ncbi:glycosyl hydrolase family 76 protein [Hirsutella rhossiliensis]|uniref:Glycosyl hydrolase family 76 protein n=1 Tax=Hirsutella rhossiliensis TaxID=111463 RepID=A0A9P8SGX3_9HYPO|nr:glycosyl hydrolase family 76 protein [Hirsutella rhossiliensis]KAH0962251.1 glycosyl hydrolase family 76 protein [Hirsutella rhossiliensis]
MLRYSLAGCFAGLLCAQSIVSVSGLRFLPGKLRHYCSITSDPSPQVCIPFPLPLVKKEAKSPDLSDMDSQGLQDVFDALAVLQDSYYDAVNGTWPTSIDWTGAVIETVLSGTLSTLTRSLNSEHVGGDAQRKQRENLISSLYAQVVHSFFGQNAIAIKNQAYDDILWVVLGWIEAIKELNQALQNMPWQGYNWFCTFAERAREFWDLATHGWDTLLCGGGMVWNPRLEPYKNAITNELWIAASIAMYENFPNDTFREAWVASKGFPTRDPVYLAAAVEGYKWLKQVNMTNQRGLYVDGYHIDNNKPNNVKCDARDEMVYTYNQGVILTGQRGLWAVTGSHSYLEEGHSLIQSVIKATGWDLLPPWHGLGRGGILEEMCDASGTCSQDGQTFKGIFFHHLTAFCAPIEAAGVATHGTRVSLEQHAHVQAAHGKACRAYLSWVKHNARAALGTRDERGRFGMWWGAIVFSQPAVSKFTDGIDHEAPNATDYRNEGTPRDAVWGKNHRVPDEARAWGKSTDKRSTDKRDDDPNNRGRGRTVETQAGGLALLRAYWEISQQQW